MLQAALKFEKAFDRLGEEDKTYNDDLAMIKGKPTTDEWNYVRSLVPFLESYYDATLNVSGSLYVTSNEYFHVIYGIACNINDRVSSPNPNDSLMASRMKMKNDKYWGNLSNINPLLFIAVILDPRFKKKYVFFVINQMYKGKQCTDLKERVEKALANLFNYYATINNNSIEKAKRSSQVAEEGMTSGSRANFKGGDYLKSKFRTEEDMEEDEVQESELEQYLKAKKVPEHDTFDILVWWKMNEKIFPTLSLMARDILAVLASTGSIRICFQY
ncbi:zinc finger BED domain-containing protein RICESLEEPER 1-like [Rutidosis leptorrhynchoides]|uniref:zinc finger BED domain-containing protein RICESLEEPER 1-like n=1 Tax=Rutidosis leptorrhynchoides TaxID=125765 RepID=UPI003A991546